MKAILWQERFSCNLKCPYCTIHSMKAKGDCTASWQDWVLAFNKLNPGIIDITGGEPFLNKNLIDIINGLKDGIKVGITTNLTVPIDEFADRVLPRKAFSLTLSYHPSTDVISKEVFIERAKKLQSKGFSITVNFVAYPAQMNLIPGLKKEFDELGIRFHIDPYGIGNIGNYAYTEEEAKFLSEYIGDDRNFRMKEDNRPVMCSGGNNYMMVDPDGYAYRCWAKHIAGEKPFENIFNADFSILGGHTECSMSRKCGGCDRDKVNIYGE